MSIAQDKARAKSQELRAICDVLLSMVEKSRKEVTPLHEVEARVFQYLRAIGYATLELLVESVGDGDCGPVYELPTGQVVKRSDEPVGRSYTSIFGTLYIERYVYAAREGQKVEFAEVDARLALPEGKFSFLLQDWDQHLAMELPFKKVGEGVARILGFDQHVDSLERMNRAMAGEVEAFHGSQLPPPVEEEGQLVVQCADSKGVPIRRPADAPTIEDHRHCPGPKPNRKKMATVAAVYTVDPVARTAEDVVESLFRDPHEPREARLDRPRPCHKRLRAMLNHQDQEGESVHGRAAVFGWIADEVAARQNGKTVINIMDGQEDLWRMRDVFQDDTRMVDILDLLHVTPRLWDAAAMFHPRGSKEASAFVRLRLLKILRGQVDGVIRGLLRMGTQRLSAKDRSKIDTICAFFRKNQDRMRYDEYLRNGYPIASGVIEGACRHVVKDRLERSGMSWTISGAQAMLDLRCVYLSGQWDEYVSFRIAKQIESLYPHRDKLQGMSWKVAA